MWAAAAWGLCCLGRRAHEALQKEKSSDSPGSDAGNTLQARQPATASRHRHHHQQQQPAGAPAQQQALQTQQAGDGGGRGLARWASQLDETQVTRLGAGAGITAIGKQLWILQQDLTSGVDSVTYILLQVSDVVASAGLCVHSVSPDCCRSTHPRQALFCILHMSTHCILAVIAARCVDLWPIPCLP
jgi:hypothetical protein